MKCKAQWNVTPSWHKGKNLCQDSWSSHRKTAFIGTRPDTNSSELGTAFKALLSLASNMSPSELAERVHYHFLNLRGMQNSNIVFTATRRKKFLFPDRTYIRPVMTCITRGERSILYMHILHFLETFLDLSDTNESFASNGYNSNCHSVRLFLLFCHLKKNEMVVCVSRMWRYTCFLFSSSQKDLWDGYCSP